jgi:hypothetical protein
LWGARDSAGPALLIDLDASGTRLILDTTDCLATLANDLPNMTLLDLKHTIRPISSTTTTDSTWWATVCGDKVSDQLHCLADTFV